MNNLGNLVMIRKRENNNSRWLEIVVVGDAVEIYKRAMSWDLNQVKGWL